MSRILVLGASGMLGHKLCQELPKGDHEVIGTVRRPQPQLAELLDDVELRSDVDVLEGDAAERAIAEIAPEFVVNAVGVVKQFDESSNKYLAAAINTWLPHRLARACREQASQLIHMSTDCVFSGDRGLYEEGDVSDARDLYGKSKFLGEPDSDEPAALTIRSSIIGRELHERTHGLVEWLLAQKGKTINGFARAIYSGFTTIEMARIMAMVIERHPELSGVYQVASEPINKFDLLNLMRELWNLDVEIQREEEFSCDRSLTMERFANETGYRAPSWPEMVQEMGADVTSYDDARAAFMRA